MIDYTATSVFERDETTQLIADSASKFSRKHIKPNVMEWDENQFFPKDVFRIAGKHGFMGILIPQEYGGSGLGYHEYICIIEEISSTFQGKL